MKTMKNLIALLLVFTIAVGLAACQTNNAKTEMDDGSENNGDGAFSSAENAVYGKITDITGNEIKVALAQRTEPEDTGEDLKNTAGITPSENDMPIIGGEDKTTSGDITFTGETMSLTLPAGVGIYSMGQEIPLSSLKKGDMVTISFDSDAHDHVTSVEKVE